MTKTRPALVVVALVLACSCAPAPHEELSPLQGPGGLASSGDQSSGAAASPASMVDIEFADVALDLAPWPEPVIELVDPGSEPRQVLAFDPRQGTTLRVRTFESWDAVVVLPGYTEEEHVSGVEIDHDVSVLATEGGSFALNVRFVNYHIADPASLDPDLVADLRYDFGNDIDTIERIVRRTDGTTVNQASVTSSGSVDRVISPDVHYPFPTEPVGIGALWEVRSQLESDGAAVETVSRIELTDIQPDQVTARVETTGAAAPGALTPDGHEIVSLDAQESGIVTWMLKSGFVLRDLTSTTRMDMRATQGGVSFEGSVSTVATSRMTLR